MRKVVAVVVILVLLISLSSCGISQEKLDEVVQEKDVLQSELDRIKQEANDLQAGIDSKETQLKGLQSKYSELKSDYDDLKDKTKDWIKLTEEEKAEKLAKAEADRIAAEAKEKKAKEEKLAAEKAAKEEAARKAAKEAAAKAEEEKKGYNTGITFNDLARNPDKFEGKKVKFKGKVLQVSELTNEVQIRLATKKTSYGSWFDNVIYVYFDTSLITSRILEDDIVTIYGVAKGLHSYTTVMGASVTLPLVEVDKIDH